MRTVRRCSADLQSSRAASPRRRAAAIPPGHQISLSSYTTSSRRAAEPLSLRTAEPPSQIVSANLRPSRPSPAVAKANPQASRTVVLRALRASSSRPIAGRFLSTTRVVRDEAAPAAAAAEVSPKISSIVDSVEKLTLLEVSELVSALKVGQMLAVVCAVCAWPGFSCHRP